MSDERFMNGPRGSEYNWRGRNLLNVALAVAGLSLFSCGDVRSEFVGTRIADTCDGTWNVCSTRVGCLVGDRSYVEGRFPGVNRVAIQVFEPSMVTASFFLSEIAGAGEETVVTFYEGSCTAPVRVEVTGTTFIGEAEKVGYVSRSADLMTVGDHLIQVESDARAKYLWKIDVLPLRLKDPAGDE
jgi:hypothetical protein